MQISLEATYQALKEKIEPSTNDEVREILRTIKVILCVLDRASSSYLNNG